MNNRTSGLFLTYICWNPFLGCVLGGWMNSVLQSGCWAAFCHMVLFCFRKSLSLVVDMSHQDIYGVIAPQGSKDLEGLQRGCSFGSPLEAGRAWGTRVTKGETVWAEVRPDVELTSLGSCCSVCSYSWRVCPHRDAAHTWQGIIRIIWGSSGLWLKWWGLEMLLASSQFCWQQSG